MAVMPIFNSVTAQCVVKNVIVKVNSSIPSGTSCIVNFDFIFTIENNGGNKYIYIHSWLQNEYPNYFNWPNVPSNAKGPLASDLLLSRINLSIHNDIHTGHPLPTLLSTYCPDPAVSITPATGLLRDVYPTGDSARFTVKGVTITVPRACTDVISMYADFWSTQAQSCEKVHCVAGQVGFTIDPRITGLLNCATARTFNLQILSVAPFAISGTYKVYLDNNNSSGAPGTFGPEDLLILSNPYTTTIDGTLNGYFISNVGYPPYNNTKPDADKNLWILVQTNGYSNQALGLLANNCAPLPIKLRSFEIKKLNQAVVLNWETLMELNCKGFDVQRKLGNTGYQTIGFVNASAMEGTGNIYQFTDENLKAGAVAFYRLKIIDKDNGVAYSEIISVRNGASKMLISINPNPGNGFVNVQLASDAGTYNAVLFDYTGKVVKNFGFMQKEVFSINNMKPGMYVLKIYFKDSGEQIAERIIVQ